MQDSPHSENLSHSVMTYLKKSSWALSFLWALYFSFSVSVFSVFFCICNLISFDHTEIFVLCKGLYALL